MFTEKGKKNNFKTLAQMEFKGGDICSRQTGELFTQRVGGFMYSKTVLIILRLK